jgi:hypothetical protein
MKKLLILAFTLLIGLGLAQGYSTIPRTSVKCANDNGYSYSKPQKGVNWCVIAVQSPKDAYGAYYMSFVITQTYWVDAALEYGLDSTVDYVNQDRVSEGWVYLDQDGYGYFEMPIVIEANSYTPVSIDAAMNALYENRGPLLNYAFSSITGYELAGILAARAANDDPTSIDRESIRSATKELIQNIGSQLSYSPSILMGVRVDISVCKEDVCSPDRNLRLLGY